MLHHCTTLHHHPHDFCRVSFASSAPPPRAPPHERAVRHSSEFAATRHAQRWEDSKTTGAARARCHSRPERATWGLRPLTTLSSAIFSRARSATPRSDRFEDSKGKSALPRDALIGPVHLKSHLPSLHCFTRTQAKHHHHHVSVCLACISIPTLTSAPWPPLTRFPPTAEHPSRMRATTRSALAPRHLPEMGLLRHDLISTTTNGSRPYLITTTLFRFVNFCLFFPQHVLRARAFPIRTPEP
jgi:hypothetical protein